MQASFNKLKELSRLNILVFGDFMVDQYISGETQRISPEAPVPVVTVQHQTKKLGGAGNVVNNLCALGINVSVTGYVGEDSSGRWIVEGFEKLNVFTRHLLLQKDIPTISKTRITAQNQQLLRYDEEVIASAPESFNAYLQTNINEILQNIDAVIISDYGKGAVTTTTAQAIINSAQKNGIIVAVDPKGKDFTKYTGATICTPNAKELADVAGTKIETEDDIFCIAENLCNKFEFDYLLATRSEKGLSIINNHQKTKKDFPAYTREVIDVTGAGDTVIAYVTACMALGIPEDDFCVIANLAAAEVVSKFGSATTTVEDIFKLFNEEQDGCSKVLTATSFAEEVKKLKAKNKKIVFTNGCFDIVHAGHIASFKKAKALGDILFVGLNTDNSVRQQKGESRPVVDEQNRLKLLEAIMYIDYLILFDEPTPENLIEQIVPDVLVKGKDWQGKEVAGAAFVQAHGGKVEFIELEEGLSTTNIINKILLSNNI